MREAHRALLDSLEPEGKIIFFQAPTGYGKTSFTPTLYREIRGLGGPPALIHVLPLKAIVEQAYNDFQSILKGVNVGVQAHGIVEGKSPYLAPPLTVSTFDSFTLNLIGANVAERRVGHYLVPKAMIATSTVVLDEVHLPLYSGDDYYATSLRVSLYGLASWKNPVLVETATLPSQAMRRILRELSLTGVDVEVVEPVPENAVEECRRAHKVSGSKANCVPDKKYYEAIEAVEWRYEKHSGDPVEKVLQLVQSDQSVFRAVDSVKRAVEEYERLSRELGEGHVALLHSRLTPKDREGQLEKVKMGVKVLVGTSAVEAGVNVSFDALVTDVPWGGGAPLSLLQRMGRINRRNRSPEATVYLTYPHPGQGDLVNYLLERKPNPRLPYDTPGTKGYRELLDNFSKWDITRRSTDYWYAMADLVQRALKPYDVVSGLDSVSRMACGLIRGALLVPIMPNPLDLGLKEGQIPPDPASYVFPVNRELLAKVVQRTSNGIVALIAEAEELRGHPHTVNLAIREVDMPGQSCGEILAHMLKHGVAAYIASPGLYKPGIGLVAGGS